MKVAIHLRTGSFSDQWLEYLKKNNIDYKIVNCYDYDIIDQLNDCDVLLWHFHHNSLKDSLIAKTIFCCLNQSGKKTFPDLNSSWHFDDKISQKYLCETFSLPLIDTYVFYDQQKAIEWATKSEYPLVFKTSGGAGGVSVKLVKTVSEARKIIKKGFNKGYKAFDRFSFFNDQLLKYKLTKNTRFLFSGFYRLFVTPKIYKELPKQKGYVYFQKFVPNNKNDIRIIVIGDKAFGIIRNVRTGDFRASGSGNIDYDTSLIPNSVIDLAFDISDKLNAMCLAYDFVVDIDGGYKLVEMSYGFSQKAYRQCEGYWDRNLTFYKEEVTPEFWMLDTVLKK